MGNILAFVKQHPIMTVGGVIGVVVIVAMLSSGQTVADDAGGYVQSPVDPNAALNAQVSLASMATAAQKEIELNRNATSLQIAQLASAQADADRTAMSSLRERELQSQETLGLAQFNLQEILGKAQMEYNLQAQQDANEAQLTQFRLLMKNNAKLAEIAAAPKGLFSFLFG